MPSPVDLSYNYLIAFGLDLRLKLFGKSRVWHRTHKEVNFLQRGEQQPLELGSHLPFTGSFGSVSLLVSCGRWNSGSHFPIFWTCLGSHLCLVASNKSGLFGLLVSEVWWFYNAWVFTAFKLTLVVKFSLHTSKPLTLKVVDDSGPTKSRSRRRRSAGHQGPFGGRAEAKRAARGWLHWLKETVPL